MFRPTNPSQQAARDRQPYVPPIIENVAPKHVQPNVIRPSRPNDGTEPDPLPQAPVVSTMPQQAPPTGGPQESYAPGSGTNQNRTTSDQPYAFITNPEPTVKQPLLNKLPGNGSPIIRVLMVLGGLLVLFIIFAILKGLLISGPNLTPFVSIAQDQQEMIHLVTNASQQQGITTSNKNLAATMQLSLTSSQSKTVTYLAANHKKINQKQLSLKVSTTIDDQLTAAAAATTYNQTFQEIIKTKLTAYGTELQQTYKLEKGKKGRALLSDSYRQVQLFQTQLNLATD